MSVRDSGYTLPSSTIFWCFKRLAGSDHRSLEGFHTSPAFRQTRERVFVPKEMLYSPARNLCAAYVFSGAGGVDGLHTAERTSQRIMKTVS